MSDSRSYPVTAQLQSVYDALTQAQDCIRGETPEDVTDAEAREDTISKVRDAMRTVEAMLGVAQIPDNCDEEKELFAAATKVGLADAVKHLRDWTCYIDGHWRQKYADLLEAQAKLIAWLVSRRVAQAPTILWCCHVRGPDDVHAAPDYDTALKWADMVNAMNWRKDSKLKALDPASYEDCLLKAVPAPWPHSPESHAEDMPKSIEGFALPSTNHQSLDQLLDGMTDENRHEELPVSPISSTDRVTLPGHDETMANLDALTIGGTNFCGHGVMAATCTICHMWSQVSSPDKSGAA